VRLLFIDDQMKNLLLLAADIGVDFGAERNFGNLRGVPGHDDILLQNRFGCWDSYKIEPENGLQANAIQPNKM